jgi:hypothetical protein
MFLLPVMLLFVPCLSLTNAQSVKSIFIFVQFSCCMDILSPITMTRVEGTMYTRLLKPQDRIALKARMSSCIYFVFILSCVSITLETG